MADSKVTDFSAATSVNSADVLYLIQSSSDKKLSISTLLGNLPNTISKFSGQVVLGGTPQTIVGSGTITVTQTLTTISNTATSSLTISDGLYDGQIKIILMTAATHTSSITNNLSVTSIGFTQPGHSVQLFWYNGNWWPIGGTAVITV